MSFTWATQISFNVFKSGLISSLTFFKALNSNSVKKQMPRITMLTNI